MNLNLDTIILFVHNIENLKPFYLDGLGLDVKEEQSDQWLLLDAGDCRIGLHKIGPQYLNKENPTAKVDNNTKLSFEIFEDIHAFREKLISMNISMREVKTFEQYKYWFCDGEDPEGNVFQLRQRKP